ncbi:MAG TPA: DsrE/DsrF/DrsH-like family protein [Pseudogracilibacillus sp.]|nr:DsrE/DsrF/DrsH-like family protein [Pseudogracilibacillus sp.]
MTKIHINEIDHLKEKGAFILDVREAFEYERGHIGESPFIPLQQLAQRLDELPKDQKIYVYCQSGMRSSQAVEILKDNGYQACNLEGGFAAYRGNLIKEGLPVKIQTNRLQLQASGLQCPGPLLLVTETIEQIEVGQQLEITVTDFGFCADIEAWAKQTGHIVVQNDIQGDQANIIIQKDNQVEAAPLTETKNGATMIVFSGDLDKALASFIIATGARAMGKEVTMFFTFWGLNIIKDPQAAKVRKRGLDKLFSKMMPKSIQQLPISKMNMFGLGSKMIQHVMKRKQVDPLAEMIRKAEELGVKMVACSMSMDVMAIEEAELLPSVDIGGVGAYLGDAADSNLNLFI